MRIRLAAILVTGLAASGLALAGCSHPPEKLSPPPRSAEPALPSPSGSPSPLVTPSPAPRPAAAVACPVFPADSVWHRDVSRLPVDRRSAAYVASIGGAKHLHPDFGSGLIDGGTFGIPVTEIPAGQATVKVSFDYADESDHGPYPIPPNAKIEGAPVADGDRHVILHDAAHCKAYELYDAHRTGASWHAGSGAIFDLRSNVLRPAGWTSADAAGLSILGGLVRYDEVASGRIDHAIRITVPRSQNTYRWPARHAASNSADPALPPMGLRLRLKAGVPIASLPRTARIIAQAMKTYGVIVADNGSAWFFTGTTDSRWDNDQLGALKALTGSSFEAVDESSVQVSPNSGAARK
ncbi:MAG: hypothetical protein JWO79_2280 [Actinomycetia bacterium]|nr:hypothetical protein [Actinomycetes bacterium]